jgi:molybdopterin/thiamine biosynthesis adenylyltransferase
MSEIANKIKRVAIAGAGGIGGYVAEFLADYGSSTRAQYPLSKWKLDLYDDDNVDTSNLLHQNFTLDDLGRPKADIIAERYIVYNPIKRFMTKDDFPNYDVIFSCVDSMSFRRDLYNYGFEHPELYWIDGRCNSRQIGLMHSKLPRKTLEQTLTNSDERRGCLLEVDKKNKVSHATPIVVASMMVQGFLNHLRGEDISDRILLNI